MSSRLWMGSVDVVSVSFVGEPDPLNARCDFAFEAAHRCFVGLPFVDLAVAVSAAGAVVHADPGDSDEMQRRGQFPVTAA